jgi:hypothetical protein
MKWKKTKCSQRLYKSKFHQLGEVDARRRRSGRIQSTLYESLWEGRGEHTVILSFPGRLCSYLTCSTCSPSRRTRNCVGSKAGWILGKDLESGLIPFMSEKIVGLTVTVEDFSTRFWSSAVWHVYNRMPQLEDRELIGPPERKICFEAK